MPTFSGCHRGGFMTIDSVNGTVLALEAQVAPGPARAASQPSSSTDSHPLPAPAVLSDRKVDAVVEDNQIVYRFIDQQSGELLLQLPPEEVLRVMRNIAEMQKEIAQKMDQKV